MTTPFVFIFDNHTPVEQIEYKIIKIVLVNIFFLQSLSTCLNRTGNQNESNEQMVRLSFISNCKASVYAYLT